MEQSYWTYLGNDGRPANLEEPNAEAVEQFLYDWKHECDEDLDADYTIVRMDYAPNEIDDYHIGYTKDVTLRKGWPCNYEPYDFYD